MAPSTLGRVWDCCGDVLLLHRDLVSEGWVWVFMGLWFPQGVYGFLKGFMVSSRGLWFPQGVYGLKTIKTDLGRSLGEHGWWVSRLVGAHESWHGWVRACEWSVGVAHDRMGSSSLILIPWY